MNLNFKNITWQKGLFRIYLLFALIIGLGFGCFSAGLWMTSTEYGDDLLGIAMLAGLLILFPWIFHYATKWMFLWVLAPIGRWVFRGFRQRDS
jgi:hypothetical protein